MYYIFIAMPLLSTIKTVTQGRYSKKSINTFSDVLIYNTLVFIFSAIVLGVIFLRQIPPIEVFGFSLITAIFSILFQTFYTLALKSGPTTATIIINTFSLVITMFTGTIFYNEQWSFYNIIGFLFMSVAFYLIPARINDKKANFKWFIFTALSFLFGGLNSAIIYVFSKTNLATYQNEYTTLIFALAFVLSGIFTLFNVKVRKEPITIKKSIELPIVALVIGGAVGLYNLLNVIGYKYFPSYILLPVVCGLIIVLVMIVNAILNREKPTLKMLIGVVFAVIAIVLLNI